MKQPKKQPPKVVHLLGQLTPAENAALLALLDVKRVTLWRWKATPGDIGIHAAEVIRRYLSHTLGQPLTLDELWNLHARQVKLEGQLLAA